MGKQNKKSSTSFLVQGSILAIASIVSRIIGLIYRIPLTNIIGDTGNDYYGTAFQIYNILLIISSYSLPLAVSKLVSANYSQGRRHNVYRILKCALIFGVCTGTGGERSATGLGTGNLSLCVGGRPLLVISDSV